MTLGKRFGWPEADKAWRAHEVVRQALLREAHGPLYGESGYR